MLKTVIFDFDGTLADTRFILHKIYGNLCRKYNLQELSRQELEQLRALSIRKRSKKAGVPLVKLPRIAADALSLYTGYIRSAKPFPGIPSVIDELVAEGIVLAIISSNTVPNIKQFLAMHEMEYFSHIYPCSTLFGKHRTIRQALAEMALSGHEALYIGDELRDIRACKRVSLPVAAVTWGYDHSELLRSGKPDYLVHKPSEITTICRHRRQS